MSPIDLQKKQDDFILSKQRVQVMRDTLSRLTAGPRNEQTQGLKAIAWGLFFKGVKTKVVWVALYID